MKKPSSGVSVGLWIVAGLVGLYLLGAALLYLDALRGANFFNGLPTTAQNALEFIYRPFFMALVSAFTAMFPP